MNLVRNILSGVTFVACFLTLFLVLPASADESDLTKEGVGAFLASQKAMYPIDVELKAAGGDSLFRPKQKDLARTGQPAYQVNVESIEKSYPSFYDRFSALAIGAEDEDGKHHFESLEDWAKMGDRIMTAFYSANTSKAQSAKMKLQRDLPPEVLALMQSIPEAKKAMNDAIGALDTMTNVSENDKRVVQFYSKEIIMHMNNVKGSDGYAVSE